MERFSIFKKSSKFYWSNNRIVYPIIISCIVIYFIRAEVLKIEFSPFDKLLTILMASFFFLGILLQLIRFSKPDPLRGELDGFIAFNVDEIIVDKCVFKLDEISKIEISNEDYYGKRIGSSKGNFNSNVSNGVDNKLSIVLKNGEKKIYYYELYNSSDLQKVRNELINYNLKDKLDFENLSYVLGEKNSSEIAEFKLEIEKKRHNANTGYN